MRLAGVRGECESSAKGCDFSKCADATFRGREWKISSRSMRHRPPVGGKEARRCVSHVVTRLSFRRPGVRLIIREPSPSVEGKSDNGLGPGRASPAAAHDVAPEAAEARTESLDQAPDDPVAGPLVLLPAGEVPAPDLGAGLPGDPEAFSFEDSAWLLLYGGVLMP